MVRYVLQGRLDRLAKRLLGPLRGPLLALGRLVTLFFRWLAAWLAHLSRSTRRRVQVGMRVMGLILHPSDPNNLFTANAGGTYHMAEAGRTLHTGGPAAGGAGRGSLLMAGGEATGGATGTPAAQEDGPVGDGAPPEQPPQVLAVSLRGAAAPNTARVEQGIRQVNYRFSYLETLRTELKKMQPSQISDLNVVINRLARRWLDPDEAFEPVQRRSRLDVRKTLRYNIRRYGGKVLNFRWATKDRPVPRFNKPARILAVGDVSHSMYVYATVSLYFMHMLNFVFQVDSFVFSEKATRSTPFLNGPGTFDEKMKDLIRNARSWNAGTRFGSSLREIVASGQIDPYTYVVICTDGKVALSHGEYELINQYMEWIKRRAKMVVFLTPEAAFANSHGRRVAVDRVGHFESGIVNIPIFDLGQIWYNTLGKHADRVYHVRTVQDLVDVCEDLYRTARD